MKYATHVFDLDGVILASNNAKSKAFYRAALPYGEAAAQSLVAFHHVAGSISRRERFEHFFKGILGREPNPGEVDGLMETCSVDIARSAFACTKVPGVEDYLRTLDGSRVVVSGVETAELRRILDAQGLSQYFDHVWGGPSRKLTVLRREITRGSIALPAVYYGDAEDDYRAAKAAGLDFVFVSHCTEFEGWEMFAVGKDISVIRDFTQILAPLSSGPVKARISRYGTAIVRGQEIFVDTRLAGALVTFP